MIYYSIQFDLKNKILTSYDYNILQYISKDKILLQSSSDFTKNFIIVDSDDGIQRWKKQNIPVIAWSHPDNSCESLMDASWMILSLEALSPDYLEEIYCRYHHLPLTVLETERCYLRELTLEDYENLKICDQNQSPDSAGRFFPFDKDSNSITEKDYLSHYISHQYPFYGFGIYAAFHKKSQEFLGIAGYATCQEAEIQIGYAVMETHRQKAYATEWVQALKKYAQEVLDIKDMVVKIAKDNIPSIKVAKKCQIPVIYL